MSPPPSPSTLLFSAKKAGSSELQIWEIACKNGRGIFFLSAPAASIPALRL